MPEVKQLKFTPNIRASALAVLLLPVLISLGFWQLDRAEEKRQLQQLFEQRQSKGAIPITQLETQRDLRYQPVTLRGSFVNDKAVLLDNRIYQQRFGYEIITPFKLAEQNVLVLVNRGWLPGDPSRRTLPKIAAITGTVELSAEVYVPQGELLQLAASDSSEWPRIVQSVELDKLGDEFSTPLFPYTVRLSAGEPGSYQANWVVVNLQPEKHTGYAVQWFAMSATLLLIGFLANTNCWSLLTNRR